MTSTNLAIRVITRSANSSRSAIRRLSIFVNCLMCNFEFELSREQIAKRAKNFIGSFCSRKCSGKYRKANAIQNVERTISNSKYYKEEDGVITLL